MIRRDYLIVGAGVGGVSVCEGIREYDKKGSIMLVGADPFPPYHRPKLVGSFFGKTATQPEKLYVHDEAWFRKNNIELRSGTLVTQFNHERHLAVLADGLAIEFRKACLATGCRPRRPQVAGANLGNIFYLRSYREFHALHETIEAVNDVVIIGGGLLAAEVAAALSRRPKLRVTLVHRGPHIWGRTMDAESAAWFTEQFAKNGVKLMMNETLNGFEGRTILRNVQTKSGQRISTGAAIVAIGADMNNGLFLNTPLNYPNGTPVNEYLETDEKGVYAVGDIALFPDRIFGSVRRVEHAPCAEAQGRVAGANMTGRKRIKWEWLPWYSSDVFDLHFDFVGDFSRPPSRAEFEGDRAKKKFIARYYQGNAITGIVLCNQNADRLEQAREEIRSRPKPKTVPVAVA